MRCGDGPFSFVSDEDARQLKFPFFRPVKERRFAVGGDEVFVDDIGADLVGLHILDRRFAVNKEIDPRLFAINFPARMRVGLPVRKKTRQRRAVLCLNSHTDFSPKRDDFALGF